MLIIVDVDGVICEYDFPKLTEKYFGVVVPQDKIWTYSIEDSLGVSAISVHKMFENEALAPPQLIDGSMQTLTRLINEHHFVAIYSNRVAYMGYDGLCDWLKEYNIPHDAVAESSNDIVTFGTKAYCHIDDSPSKLLSLGDFTKRKLLFSNPWNRRCLNIHRLLERVDSWDEIYSLIQTGKG